MRKNTKLFLIVSFVILSICSIVYQIPFYQEDEKENDNNLYEFDTTKVAKIKNIIDVDTVIGEQITTLDGMKIIPVTKVSVGFVAGGGEYSQNLPIKKQKKDYPFAGGSGTGFSITPIGFLIEKNDIIKFISADNKSSFDNGWLNKKIN